jgi:SNF2 family DNA or RNA helicase
MKETTMDGLPEKSIKKYPSTMPQVQAEAYAKAVATARSGQRDQGSMLKAIHALRGISLHPDGGERVNAYDANSVADWTKSSARLEQAIGILRRIQEREEKAIIFIEDRSVQRAFAAASSLLFGLKSAPAVINGEVPGAKRQAIVDRFQSSPRGFDILVLSPKAAGIGLTITAANHVVHLSRWWNPAVEDQCNDRVYRIGQEQPVTIHIPIAVHPAFGNGSFDQTLDALLERKRALSKHMLAPPLQESDVGALFGAAVGESPGV